MKNVLFAAVSLLAVAACDGISDPVVCPAYVPYAVEVTVQDSVTGANVTPGATLVLRTGAGVQVDSVVAPPPVTTMGLGGTAGTFTVAVRQAGYRTWTKTGVKVEQGQCGVRTVDLVARLQP